MWLVAVVYDRYEEGTKTYDDYNKALADYNWFKSHGYIEKVYLAEIKDSHIKTEG